MFALAVPRHFTQQHLHVLADVAQRFSDDAFRAALRAFEHYDYEPSPPPAGDVPVTVAWGRYDLLLPHRLQAPRARALLPSARHVTLRAGHVPYFDDPDAVAAVIRATAAG